MLHYRRIGKGKPVVFLHGFLESSTMWDYFVSDTTPFESILIDLPGHGNSTLSNNCKSIADVANLVIAFLKTISVQEFDIVGHSLGGYIAIEIHKKLNLQTKLVLFHSNFWEDDAEKKANRNRIIKLVKKNKTFFIKEAIPNLFLEEFRQTEAVKKLIAEATTISAETIVLYSKMMRDRIDNTKYVLINEANTHLIQGELDAIVPVKKMRIYFDNLSNITFVKDCGHMGHIEQKEIICSELLGIISL